MGIIATTKNQPILIDFPSDFRDNGWRIVGGKAIHSGCNAGYIRNNSLNLEVGKFYRITYRVDAWSSGVVRAMMGTSSGAGISTVGIHSEILMAAGNTEFKFYADGDVTISVLEIEEYIDEISNGLTIAFNEDANRWVTYLSFKPDMMLKFLDGFYSWLNGELWEHNVNEVRNNFYGVQYTSKIVYYVNINPTQLKTFFTMRQNGNKPWKVTETLIHPSEGKSKGMRSFIPKKRFKNLNEAWVADFLRNVDDPRFTEEIVALFNGSHLQGLTMKITLENDDITEVRLLSSDVFVSPQNYTV